MKYREKCQICISSNTTSSNVEWESSLPQDKNRRIESYSTVLTRDMAYYNEINDFYTCNKKSIRIVLFLNFCVVINACFNRVSVFSHDIFIYSPHTYLKS
jgi:hypothetical protein